MASQGGNPAHKRMMNANLKAKRAQSWARGQKKKAARRAAAEELMKANLAILADLGVTRQMRERQRKDGSVVFKLESPSEALRRYYRESSRDAA